MTKKHLSQIQVNKLPDGSKVAVGWSGGNKGEYVIKRGAWGNVMAAYKGVFVDYLDHVGTTKGHDKVSVR